jgi:hypothetical protein
MDGERRGRRLGRDGLENDMGGDGEESGRRENGSEKAWRGRTARERNLSYR